MTVSTIAHRDVAVASAERMIERAITKIDVAREFLLVVLGFGLTAAIGEKLKHQHDVEITYFDVYLLIVYLIYAGRFLLNNWLFLSRFYNKDWLGALNTHDLAQAIGKSTLDFLLTIFTGLIICLASMAIYRDRLDYLCICLAMHYLVDIGILKNSIATIDRQRHDGREVAKQWHINNAFFSAVFILYVMFIWFQPWRIELNQIHDDAAAWFLISLWLVNSVIALTIPHVGASRL